MSLSDGLLCCPDPTPPHPPPITHNHDPPSSAIVPHICPSFYYIAYKCLSLPNNAQIARLYLFKLFHIADYCLQLFINFSGHRSSFISLKFTFQFHISTQPDIIASNYSTYSHLLPTQNADRCLPMPTIFPRNYTSFQYSAQYCQPILVTACNSP